MNITYRTMMVESRNRPLTCNHHWQLYLTLTCNLKSQRELRVESYQVPLMRARQYQNFKEENGLNKVKKSAFCDSYKFGNNWTCMNMQKIKTKQNETKQTTTSKNKQTNNNNLHSLKKYRLCLILLLIFLWIWTRNKFYSQQCYQTLSC